MAASEAADRPVPWMAAGPGDDLVERPGQQARLRDLLRAGDAALHGIGGAGKTTLAEQTLPELRADFPGGLLWVTVGQEATGPALALLAADLIEQLTGERPGVVTPARAGERLGAELDRRPPALLVVDDVWTAEQLEPFLTGGPGCRRLITTRVGALIPADLPRIDVGEMTHDEATALLTQGLPGLSLPDLTALLAMTGRWPLLTAVANGTLRQGVAPHQLVDQLGAGGWVALDLTVPGERERAVDAFVTAALDVLPEEDRRRYLELGIFPDGGWVPDAISGPLWSGTGGLSPAGSEDLRTTFAGLALLQKGPAGVRLHDVLRTYVRNRLPEDELAQVNRRLVEMARPRSGGPWWTLPRADRYLWRHLAFHLREARWWDELFATVADLRRLAVQIPLLGVAAAVADLARVPDPRAAALCARLSRGAHLLHPIRPAAALTDVLLSRLAGAPELAADVAGFAAAQRTRAGLTARWPLPDVGPDSLTRVVGGDAGWLDCVAVPPGADWIATGGDTGVISLYDWAEGGVLARFGRHTGAVKSLAVTYDGAFLISAGVDGTLRLWDVARRQERILWTTSGEVLGCAAAPGSHRIAAVSGTGEVIVLDVAGNWRILGHRGGEKLIGCAFLDDDRVLTVTEDGAVAGHELRSGRRKALVAAGTTPVAGFAVDPGWVALGGVDGTIRVHPLRGGGAPVTLGGHRGCVSAVAAFGDRIISGGQDGTVRVFDRYGMEVAVVRAHPSWVTGCVIGPDRRTLITTGSDGTVRIWDLPRLVQETVGGPVDWVNTCAVSPVDSSLVSGGRDGVVRSWRDASGVAIWSGDEPVRRCVAGASGDLVVAVSATRATILRRPLPSAGSAPEGVPEVSGGEPEASKGGREASGGGSAAAGGRREASTGGWEASTGGWEAEVLLGAAGCVTAPDQDLIAWWDPEGGLKVRSVTGAETFRRTHSRPIHAAAFLPGHRLIAADAAGALLVWQYRKDRIRSLPGRHLVGEPGSPVIQTTPDRVAVVGTRGIELLDVRGLRPIAVAEFPDGPVTHGAISADGHWLATTSEAGELRIWPLAGLGDAPRWHPVAAMRVDGALFECAWVPETLDLYAAGRRGVYAFTFRPPRPVPHPAGAADRRSSAQVR